MILENEEVAECCFIFLYSEIVRQIVTNYGQLSLKDPVNGSIQADDIYIKLEALGYEVGFRMVERLAKDRPPFIDPLEILKYICKEFWIKLFKKQIDKLQTNHRGIYVLQDFNFRWLMNMSAEDDEKTKENALTFLIFPCGIIRGALSNLGMDTIVNADITTMPGCIVYLMLKLGIKRRL